MNFKVEKVFYFYFILLIVTFSSRSNAFAPADILKRFEYKLSFKGPHLVFKDGTVPFWEHSGDAIASNDQIRITPSLRSQKGRIWSRDTMPNNDWEIEVSIRINGRGRIGADGMAIWYTDKIGTDGPVFGSNDYWNGLGIFLDSFDNDMQNNNPYILVMNNDGTKTYEHDRDGISQQIGGCLRDFRNKPFPIRLKIEYYKKTLTVFYHDGLNNDATSFEICARIENIHLPLNGHFGVSAATGGLADDHDVLSFVTHSLIDTNSGTATHTTEEQIKYDKEYEQFLAQMELEKEKYKKEHPEKIEEIDEKQNYESESDRQFRNILEVQNSIHQSIRLLDSKLAEVLGRQERIVGLMSNNQAPNTNTNQGNVVIDTFKRDEVVQVMNQQNELVRSIRDIHSSIQDVQRKTNTLHEKIPSPIASQMNGNNNNNNNNNKDSVLIHQMNEALKSIRIELSNAVNRNNCPEPSCLSTFYFVAIILVQSVLFIGYFFMKSRSESQLKKFY